MNQRIDEKEILRASADILISDERITMVFTENSVAIKLPTTRRLAEHFGVQNYYILPLFSLMEQGGLIRRIEREGIFTTGKGSLDLFRMIEENHEKEAVKILGNELFYSLFKRVNVL